MTRVLYPGSFNPITLGHMNIIKQASNLFDEIVIAVLYNNLKKDEFLTIDERYNIIKEIYKDDSNVLVIKSDESAVDVASSNNCGAMIRGIRNVSDLDYEMQLAYINNDLSNNKIKTVNFFPDLEYQFVSSTMVRELYRLNKDISKYVDSVVENKLIRKE